MYREFAHRVALIGENTTTKIYGVSANHRYHYPYKLAHPESVGPAQRQLCFELMLDSKVGDSDVTNETVLKAADRVNADSAIPNDYILKPYETHESNKQFLRLYEDSDWNNQVYMAMQPPYDRTYEEFEEFYSERNHFALGGLQSVDSADQQVRYIKDFLDVVHDDVTVHGFGVGTNWEIIRACKEDGILDSLDIGTPERAAANNNLVDASMSQSQYLFPKGEDISTIRGQFMQDCLDMLNYIFTDRPDDEWLEKMYRTETVGEALDSQASIQEFMPAEATAAGEF